MINVSIIVPVRNGEAFLYKSIKNLIHCTSYSDEIIYVDDNSTDQSLKILKEMQKLHRRIIIKRNPGMGLVDALNHGVDSSTNDWIARFDVDDEYPEDRLKEQKRFINLNVVAIFCDYEFRGANDEYLGKVPSPVFDEAIKVS